MSTFRPPPGRCVTVTWGRDELDDVVVGVSCVCDAPVESLDCADAVAVLVSGAVSGVSSFVVSSCGMFWLLSVFAAVSLSSLPSSELPSGLPNGLRPVIFSTSTWAWILIKLN